MTDIDTQTKPTVNTGLVLLSLFFLIAYVVVAFGNVTSNGNYVLAIIFGDLLLSLAWHFTKRNKIYGIPRFLGSCVDQILYVGANAYLFYNIHNVTAQIWFAAIFIAMGIVEYGIYLDRKQKGIWE